MSKNLADDVFFVQMKLEQYRQTPLEPTKWNNVIRAGALNDAIWYLWSKSYLSIDGRGWLLAMSQLEQFTYLQDWVLKNDPQ